MNAKLAKALRKKAKKLTEGIVPTAYLKSEETSSIEIDPTTTRGTYRELKKYIKEKYHK